MRIDHACMTAAVVLIAAPPAHGTAGDDFSGDITVTIHELHSDFELGYQMGVKQVLGAVKDGLNIHQITRSDLDIDPPPVEGNPDYLLWVDEATGSYGVSEMPTATVQSVATNPGGMVAFDEQGHVWYTFGARVQDMPPTLFRSRAPFSVAEFDVIAPEYLTAPGGSTTFLLHAHDPKIMLLWRERNSAHRDAGAHFRRYDMNQGFQTPELDFNIGSGVVDPVLDVVGIEQLWSRYDPRFGYMFATWQWFDVDAHNFGSNPFLFSDDDGETWRTADGAAVQDLPIDYTERDATLVPFDHLEAGVTTLWFPRDMGVAPDGTFWIQLPTVNARLNHFWFENGVWQSQPLSLSTPLNCYACGATRDYLVFLYSDANNLRHLFMRYSADGGRTWSDPILVDDISQQGSGETLFFCWASFVQPAHEYTDNAARFFYGYYRTNDGPMGARFRNNIRWARIDLPDPGHEATMVDLDAAFGSVVDGGLAEIIDSDDAFLRVQSQFGFSAAEPNILDVRIGAISPAAAPASLNLEVEAMLNNPGGVQTLSLRNWSSGAFEEIDVREIGSVEQTVLITDISPADRIRAKDQRVELSIAHSVIATFSASGFEASIDHCEILSFD